MVEKKRGRQRAAALRYCPEEDQAPRVTAQGAGFLARKIIALARSHGVPLHEDPALVEVLAQLEFRQEIPPSLYLVVAEILAFVYTTHRKNASREL